MRITKHTDYALRILLYLAARPKERVTTKAIGDAYDISTSHLQKIVRALGELGVVELFRGVGGGIELKVSPSDISIGSVVRALDDSDSWIECFQPETNTCVVAPSCGLKGALREAQEAFYAALDPVTIGAVVRGRGAQLRALTGD